MRTHTLRTSCPMPVPHARGALGSAGSSKQRQWPICRLTEHRTLQWNYQNVKERFEYATYVSQETVQAQYTARCRIDPRTCVPSTPTGDDTQLTLRNPLSGLDEHLITPAYRALTFK